jgi:hypothetical protein
MAYNKRRQTLGTNYPKLIITSSHVKSPTLPKLALKAGNNYISLCLKNVYVLRNDLLNNGHQDDEFARCKVLSLLVVEGLQMVSLKVQVRLQSVSISN